MLRTYLHDRIFFNNVRETIQRMSKFREWSFPQWCFFQQKRITLGFHQEGGFLTWTISSNWNYSHHKYLLRGISTWEFNLIKYSASQLPPKCFSWWSSFLKWIFSKVYHLTVFFEVGVFSKNVFSNRELVIWKSVCPKIPLKVIVERRMFWVMGFVVWWSVIDWRDVRVSVGSRNLPPGVN